jgi:hypothetical protein
MSKNMANKWDFVPPCSNNPCSADANESKKFVRQRAMKDFREKQRIDRAKALSCASDELPVFSSLRPIVSKPKKRAIAQIGSAALIEEPDSEGLPLQPVEITAVSCANRKCASSMVMSDATGETYPTTANTYLDFKTDMNAYDPLAMYGLPRDTKRKMLFDHCKASFQPPKLYLIKVP